MGLHLVKLCVGAESIEDLVDWQKGRLAERKRLKLKPPLSHVTRMVPKRQEELLDGGSLYWVIKGFISVRQQLKAIEPFKDTDGIRRCHLVLDPKLVPTGVQPRRPFQGWRYLKVEDAPKDLKGGLRSYKEIPPKLRLELGELGLL